MHILCRISAIVWRPNCVPEKLFEKSLQVTRIKQELLRNSESLIHYSFSSYLQPKGILCLADEVQCGFYRSGTHMWGFQTHGDIRPDFVTIGKSMGNGHPVSCLVLREELAENFGKDGLKYFNTVIKFYFGRLSDELELKILFCIKVWWKSCFDGSGKRRS